jgi:TRAP-type C4-dicarboxylate transport system permease small subunit
LDTRPLAPGGRAGGQPTTLGEMSLEKRPLYVRVMDRLYDLCYLVAMVAIVCITILIFVGVVMRYVFWMGAAFAEPVSIFFIVQLTMYGAAACYRARIHLRLMAFVSLWPERAQRVLEIGTHVLMAVVAATMIYYGIDLVKTTWFQSYAEFRYIRVGLVYSAIPGSGLVTLLFAIEALIYPSFKPSIDDDDVTHLVEDAADHRGRTTL